jgi:hypothetical protein
MLPTNLYSPVAGDHGAHGIFDDEAYSHSIQSWADSHRNVLALGGVALAAAVVIFGASGKGRKRSAA